MTHTAPIPGMTTRPDPCGGCEPALGWPGFLGCVRFAFQHHEFRQSFEKETGVDLIESSACSAEERALVFARFSDWVAVNVWGVEEEPK